MNLLLFISCLSLFLLINGLFADQTEVSNVDSEGNNKTWGLKLKENNTVCVLFSFNRTTIVISSKETIISNKTYKFKDSEVVSDESYCFDDNQRMSLRFSDDFILKVDFKLNSSIRAPTYTLSQLTLEVRNTSLLSQLNSTSSSAIKKSMTPDLKVKPIGRGYTFECKNKCLLRIQSTKFIVIFLNLLNNS